MIPMLASLSTQTMRILCLRFHLHLLSSRFPVDPSANQNPLTHLLVAPYLNLLQLRPCLRSHLLRLSLTTKKILDLHHLPYHLHLNLSVAAARAFHLLSHHLEAAMEAVSSARYVLVPYLLCVLIQIHHRIRHRAQHQTHCLRLLNPWPKSPSQPSCHHNLQCSIQLLISRTT